MTNPQPPSARVPLHPRSADGQLPERAQASVVTLTTFDRRERTGRLPHFSPYKPDLALEMSQEGERTGRVLVAAEQLAMIAFHRDTGDALAPANKGGEQRLRIHMVGGHSLVVDVVGDSAHALGFYATPVDPGCGHREYFFYAHGVNARERVAPLGELLVEEGKISAQDLRRGLESQATARVLPIGQILLEQRKIDDATLDQALELQRRRRLRLGEVLIEAGLASPEAIEAALEEQRRRKGKRLGELLIGMGIVTELDIISTLAKKFQLPLVDLDRCALNAAAAAEVPRDVIAKYGVLPVETDAKSLTVAISDPLATDAIDVLRISTKRHINEVMVTPSQLHRYVQRHLEASRPAPGDGSVALDDILRHLAKEELQVGLEEEEDDQEISVAESDSGVIRLVNQIILDAYRRGASDIHVEPNGREQAVLVRFRVDGDCVRYQELPAAVRGPIVARLKIMAKLDIAERRKPQDGKIRFKMSDRVIELRVATLPTVNGNEDVVLRILAASKPLPLSQIGLRAPLLEALRGVLAKPYGLFLCVGPTGSGKTTTLHSALGHLNTPDAKIWTAEDPVEITQPGLRQVQVHAKIGFTFAAAMRAFLRADPDVIMVGEMRDVETAGAAIEASLTGHLVLSTLHTNSAPETVTRLLDMGLDPFSFADALLGVLAQRLARALCKQCRAQGPGTREEYEEMALLFGGEEEFVRRLGVAFGPSFQVYRARGCGGCSDGYKGRLGLHELLVTNDIIKRAITLKAPVAEVRELAIASGMATLAQDGVEKALAGLTDMRQVLAVCSR